MIKIFAIPDAAQTRYHSIEELVVAGASLFHSEASIRASKITLTDTATLQNDFEMQVEEMIWRSGTLRGSKPQVK